MSELEIIKLALGDKIENVAWDIDGWMILLKDSRLRSLKVSRRLVGISFDWEWHFVAPVILREEVGEDDVKLYREMKRREVQIRRRGVIRYSYEWVTSELLTKVFPEVTPTEDLKMRLNKDGELHRLLKRSSIDELHVNTYFEIGGFGSPDEALKKYFESPVKLGWLITAIKGPGSEWRFGPIVKRIYELLNHLAEELLMFTEELEPKASLL